MADHRCTVEKIEPGAVCDWPARFALTGGMRVCRHHLGEAVELRNRQAAPHQVGGLRRSVPVWIIRDERG